MCSKVLIWYKLLKIAEKFGRLSNISYKIPRRFLIYMPCCSGLLMDKTSSISNLEDMENTPFHFRNAWYTRSKTFKYIIIEWCRIRTVCTYARLFFVFVTVDFMAKHERQSRRCSRWPGYKD